MKRLLPKREAQDAAVKIFCREAENCVGERVLTEQIGFNHIGKQAATPCCTDTHPARLVNCPIKQNQREKIRTQRKRESRQRQQVCDKRDKQSQHDEPELRRQQNVFRSCNLHQRRVGQTKCHV
jgi:hypothetical protein